MKRSMVFILFFISSPILLAARVIQQLYMIDPATGFYLSGFAGIGTAISVMCFALIAITLALVWLSHPQVPVIPKKSKGLGFSAFFAATCMIISSVGKLLERAGADKIVGILGIAAAIALVYYGVTLFSGADYPGMLTVLPILYSCVRLVIDFIKYTGEVIVTDAVFDVVTMCLVLLFFYTSGKLIAEVDGKRTHILYYSYGLCAAFFCADSAFVRIILALTHSNAALHGSGKFDIAFVGLAVYIVASVWVLSDRSRKPAPQAVCEKTEDATDGDELAAE